MLNLIPDSKLTNQREFPRVECIRHPQACLDSERIIDFLNSEVRIEYDFSVRDEYPSLFGDYPGGYSYYIRVGDRIVSHVAGLIRQFYHSDFEIRIGLIGSVVTAKEYQRRGFAKYLLKHLLMDQKRLGCVISLLWSEKPDLYTSLGFHRAGRERDFRFKSDSVPIVKEGAIEFEARLHCYQMWRLYQKKGLRIDRSLEEHKHLCIIPQTRIFVTQLGEKITSYIAINKGADFENYIHEWAGDLFEIQRNIAWVQKYHFSKVELTLIGPAEEAWAPIRSIAHSSWEGVVGLIKVLDREALFLVYKRYLKKRGMDYHVLRSGVIEVEGHRRSIGTEGELLATVLGGEEMTTHPRLPFYIWGFDSI